MMSAKDIQKSREEIEKKMNDIGESTLFSTGVAYATKCDKAAGVDIDKIQTDYLWKEGGRMLGIAFMILVAAIGVGFLASKVGASVGRDLRGKIYKKVMGFSNAEMNRFSTASQMCIRDRPGIFPWYTTPLLLLFSILTSHLFLLVFFDLVEV